MITLHIEVNNFVELAEELAGLGFYPSTPQQVEPAPVPPAPAETPAPVAKEKPKATKRKRRTKAEMEAARAAETTPESETEPESEPATAEVVTLPASDDPVGDSAALVDALRKQVQALVAGTDEEYERCAAAFAQIGCDTFDDAVAEGKITDLKAALEAA